MLLVPCEDAEGQGSLCPSVSRIPQKYRKSKNFLTGATTGGAQSNHAYSERKSRNRFAPSAQVSTGSTMAMRTLFVPGLMPFAWRDI